MHNELGVFKLVNEMSKKIDLDEHKTVIEIEDTDNPSVKELNLKSGSWSPDEPWFVVDENKILHTMMPVKSVEKIVKNFHLTQEENFKLKLEKSIWQNIPIDFQDVWSVVMDEIKTLSKQETSIDIDRVITKIKNRHPNLFFNSNSLNIPIIR